MNFLQTLSESRLLSSRSAYRRYSARQIAELVYLHIIGLRILASEPATQKWAHDYAFRSGRYLGFAKYYQNATDLHLLLFALVDEEVDLKMPEISMRFKETLYFDDAEIKKWLRDMAHGVVNEPRMRTLFMRLDGQFQIKDSSMKAIRRIVQDWPRDTLRQKQLAMTRLLQIMRNRCRMSDILEKLEEIATRQRLELDGVANAETGDEAADDGTPVKPKKKMSTLDKVGAALGGVLGYRAVRSMFEEEETKEPRFYVTYYHDELTHQGPYFAVKDRRTGEEAGYFVKGVAYPADGFKTRRSAETVARKLNREYEEALAKARAEKAKAETDLSMEAAENELEEDAAAGATASGDVAGFAQPMGAVQRRIPRKKRK